MDWALNEGLRASPSDLPAQTPFGVGCVQRPSREHERPAPRLRVRSFPAISDPAGNTTSADFSTANGALSGTAVPSHPASTPSVTGHPGTPAEISASKTSNRHRTPTAFTERPLDDIGLRLVVQTRPDRPAFYAQHAETVTGSDAPCVPRVATSHSDFLPTQPHDCAVAIGLWLVPSTSTGDSHPRAAGHVARTPCVRFSRTRLSDIVHRLPYASVGRTVPLRRWMPSWFTHVWLKRRTQLRPWRPCLALASSARRSLT
jgi:hypothetical protein